MRFRWLLAILVTGGAVSAFRFATHFDGRAVAAPPPIVWETLEPGAAHAMTAAAPSLELYRFELKFFRLAVVIPKGPPPSARASDVLRGAPDAVAAVNGGFFDEHGRSLGLRIAAGKVVVPLRPHVDWGVLSFAAGRARIVHSSEFVATPDLEAAMQVGPRIVIDGGVPRLKPQSARRTAVALDQEGTTVTLVVAPEPIDATTLGTRLAALGFHSALMLDGGPSTQLAVKLGAKDAPSREIAGAYAVPDLLAVYRRRVERPTLPSR